MSQQQASTPRITVEPEGDYAITSVNQVVRGNVLVIGFCFEPTSIKAVDDGAAVVARVKGKLVLKPVNYVVKLCYEIGPGPVKVMGTEVPVNTCAIIDSSRGGASAKLSKIREGEQIAVERKCYKVGVTLDGEGTYLFTIKVGHRQGGITVIDDVKVVEVSYSGNQVSASTISVVGGNIVSPAPSRVERKPSIKAIVGGGIIAATAIAGMVYLARRSGIKPSTVISRILGAEKPSEGEVKLKNEAAGGSEKVIKLSDEDEVRRRVIEILRRAAEAIKRR